VLDIKPGVYLVDKPSGPSSHDVVNYFRKKSGIKRIGHCGTLDPLASGLLIILVGREHTREQSLYLKKDKEYLVTARLGIETDSYDQTGKIINQADWQQLKDISKTNLKKVISQFKGQIQQTVPIFSAIKIKGQKLYQKARKGETVELPSRLIEIKKIALKKFKKDVKNEEINFELMVACSSGTYVRSLIQDIGKKLQCGANVSVLRRLKIGKFNVKKGIKLKIEDFKMALDN
jgi:tRNA pseudouridine55 synthase